MSGLAYTANGSGLGQLTLPTIITTRNPINASAGVQGDISSPSGQVFSIGQLWQNSTTQAIYMLVASGTWQEISASTGNVESISGDTGTATPTAGNIKIAGTANQVLSTASGSTDTLSLIGPYTPATYTANGILYGNGTSSILAMPALTSGQTIVGVTGGAPVATTVTNSKVSNVPEFDGIPSMSASTGGVAAVTINTYNIWSFPEFGTRLEQYNTTVATNIAPVVSGTLGKGLNIDNIGAGDSKSIEITEGNTINSKNAFVVGTSPAFYVKFGFSIVTLADVVSLTCGFRKVQTYQATLLTGYTDYACIGVQNSVASGEIQIQTQVGSGGETKTDTTQLATAATTFTVQVNVSTGGVVTYLFNGAAPTVTAAYTFTSALTVIPFMVYTSASGAHAEVDLVSYECGLQ